MRRLLTGLCLAGLVVALSGCGNITGHWAMQSIEPPAAKGKFDMGCLCLNKDGTYKAFATYGGGEKKELSGKYEYDQNTKLLTFVEGPGKERVYKAELTCAGDKMKVSQPGEEWTATMKRCKCGDTDKCPPSACCGKCGGAKCDPAKCPGQPKAKDEPKAKEQPKGKAEEKPKAEQKGTK